MPIKVIMELVYNKIANMYFRKQGKKLPKLITDHNIGPLFNNEIFLFIAAGLPDGTYIFNPKIPVRVNFGGSCTGRC
jgi:hypothetical protein